MWTSPPFARNSVAGFSMVVYLAVISASESRPDRHSFQPSMIGMAV
jgi:hypothetical protein